MGGGCGAVEPQSVLTATRGKLEKLMANNSVKAVSDLPGFSHLAQGE